MTAALPRRMTFRSRGALVAAGLVALVALVVGGVLLLLAAINEDTLPEPVGAFAPPPDSGIQRYDVRTADAGRLRVVDESGAERELVVGAGAAVTVLEPIAHSTLGPGDWVTVVVVSNQVRNYAIRALVAVPADVGAGTVDGFLRLPGGFAGHEASRDPAERPLVGGTVRATQGKEVALDAGTGPITLLFEPDAPLRRAVKATATAVRPGDRIAVTPDGSVLVLR